MPTFSSTFEWQYRIGFGSRLRWPSFSSDWPFRRQLSQLRGRRTRLGSRRSFWYNKRGRSGWQTWLTFVHTSWNIIYSVISWILVIPPLELHHICTPHWFSVFYYQQVRARVKRASVNGPKSSCASFGNYSNICEKIVETTILAVGCK